MVFVIRASIVADSRQGFMRLCLRKQLAKGYVSDLTQQTLVNVFVASTSPARHGADCPGPVQQYGNLGHWNLRKTRAKVDVYRLP
jgi:hypothetical protein